MLAKTEVLDPSSALLAYVDGKRFKTIMADPPWRFQNSTGKVAPEHKRLNRYGTMTLDGIKNLPVSDLAGGTAHLYLWVPNALLPDGLAVMAAWGFTYKSNVVWHKIRKDGGSDGRGVGFYFRNVTELILFGVRGKTLAPSRRAVGRLICFKPENVSIPASLMSNMTSSKLAPLALIWSFSVEAFVRGGRHGATKLMTAMSRRGRRMLIILRRAKFKSSTRLLRRLLGPQ